MIKLSDYLRFCKIALPATRTTVWARTTLGATSLAVAQVLQTLALFLPIKILMMLSGSGALSIDAYLPLSHEQLLIGLGAAVPFLYAGSILFTGFFQRTADQLNGIPSTNFPGGIAPIEPSRLRRIRTRMMKHEADLLTILLCLMMLTLMNWPIAIAVFMASSIAVWLLDFTITRSTTNRHTPLFITDRQLVDVIRITAHILLFLAIAAQVLYAGVNVYIALLSMLLCRLSISSVQRSYNLSLDTRRQFAKRISQVVEESKALALKTAESQ